MKMLILIGLLFIVGCKTTNMTVEQRQEHQKRLDAVFFQTECMNPALMKYRQ